MDFLYSRNRLNVATSRARCVAVVVASPDLLACPGPDTRRRCAWPTRSAGSSSSPRRDARALARTPPRGPDARPRLSCARRATMHPAAAPIIRRPSTRPRAARAAPAGAAPPHGLVARGRRRARQHRAHRRGHRATIVAQHLGGSAVWSGVPGAAVVLGAAGRRGRPSPASWSGAAAGSGSAPATDRGRRGAPRGRGDRRRVAARHARRDGPHRVRQRLEPAVAVRGRGPLPRRPAGVGDRHRRLGRHRRRRRRAEPRRRRRRLRDVDRPARARRAVPRPDHLRRGGGDPELRRSCDPTRTQLADDVLARRIRARPTGRAASLGLGPPAPARLGRRSWRWSSARS